jgi:hypothetical protein
MPTLARPTGRSGGRRGPAVVIGAAWVLAAVLVLAFARVTAIGPVIATLYGTHGVHVADLVALLVAGGSAAAVTVRALRD